MISRHGGPESCKPAQLPSSADAWANFQVWPRVLRHSGRSGELAGCESSSETEIASRPYRHFARPRGGDHWAAILKNQSGRRGAREEWLFHLLLPGPTNSETLLKWATGIRSPPQNLRSSYVTLLRERTGGAYKKALEVEPRRTFS